MATPGPGHDGSQTPAQLRLESTIRDGQPVTVIRDDQGNIALPTYVPAPTEFPISPTTDGVAPPPPGEGQLKKSDTDPPALKTSASSTHKKLHTDRPSIDQSRKWVTEAPPRRRGGSEPMPPAPRRAGTSYRYATAWQSYSDDSSSSSDSDDDDGEQAAGREARPRVTPPGHPDRVRWGGDDFKSKGKMKQDGRVRISVNKTGELGYLAKAIGSAVKKVAPSHGVGGYAEGLSRTSSTATDVTLMGPLPRLNIVIMVIGSRGDAQPFLKVGKVLKEKYGHRVRIATHPAFREFVERDSGLEFFSVGGDPSELMAFMVKNPGMIPTLETVRAGDIGRRRAAMAEMFAGFWRACINATDNEKDTRNLRMMGDKDPFIADAIIANPPSFAHIHCAEALGVPLHLMFTFPYTPTEAFPHPMASIKKSNAEPGYTNFISYPLVEMVVWNGLGDLINDFRVKMLGLDPVSTLWAPNSTYRLHVPITYMWSPGFVPKPEDWGDEVDVSGFVFLDLASTYKPPPELEKFLNHEEKPVYIGFGSIVVDDADRFTEMIFDAVEQAGVRALISKGWGGLGGQNTPDNIYMLEDTPHDWLFPKVRGCVIHGGAGTTAIALKCGKPTMVVPFFGDQQFWGSMVANAGAGPPPVPYKRLDAEKLAEGIKVLLIDEAQSAAAELARDIEREGDGAENACRSFHRHLTLSGPKSIRCSLLPDHPAAWEVKDSGLKLSTLAADILVDKSSTHWRRLRLLRHVEWNDFEGPGEPVTGIAGSLVGTVSSAFTGVGGVPYRIAKVSKKQRERKQRHRQARAAARKALNGNVTKGKASENEKLEQKSDLSKQGDGQQEDLKKAEPKPEDANQASEHAEEQAADLNREDKEKGGANQKQEVSAKEKEAASKIQTTTAEEPNAVALNRATTGSTTNTIGPDDYVGEVTSGIGQTAGAIAKAPINLSMAVAQGLHNAPRLYGDDTVRRPPRVTGIRSGFKAAGLEFTTGIYDGVTGLVRLPVRGAKKDGGKGLVKGVGMGIGGFVLKDLAAVTGLFSYPLKGAIKQLERNRGPTRRVRRGRIAQGQRELRLLSAEDRKRVEADVCRRWDVMQALLHKIAQAENEESLLEKLSPKMRARRQAVLENVSVAEKALAALKRGEPLSLVFDQEEGDRAEEDQRRKPTNKRNSSEESKSATSQADRKKEKKQQERTEDENLFEDMSNMGENGSSSR